MMLLASNTFIGNTASDIAHQPWKGQGVAVYDSGAFSFFSLWQLNFLDEVSPVHISVK